MYARLLCTAFVIMVGAPLVTYAQVENLVLNPSFEEDEVILDDPDWEQWATWGYETGLGSTVEVDETRAVDGQRSLRVEPTGEINWYFVVLYSPMSFEVGEDFTASLWAVAEEPRPFTMNFKATDNSVSWGETTFELTTEWAEYAVTSEALNAEAKLELFCSASDVTFWVDYVFVYKGEYIAGLNPSGSAKAIAPNPANGAVYVSREPTLGWTSGKSAGRHEVYLGTDANDVNNADVTDTTGIYRGSRDLNVTSYVPTEVPLEWGQTYYWRVDEVNETEPNSPWKGDLWSFTTADFIVVEDFEDYNDYEPDTVYLTWIDGYGDPTNGSTSGYPEPIFSVGEHFLETVIVHSGQQSMPLFYDNGVGLSEVTKTLTDVRDWTQEDVITLTLFYQGNLANDAEPMYVALDGDAVVTNGNPKAAQINDWARWDIFLQRFADMGVDLTNVDTISIGFGNKAAPVAGGSGYVLFDDIRLYRTPPVEPEPAPEPVDPGTDALVAYYALDNNILDGSGNGHDGTVVGSPTYVAGKIGMALSFDGNDSVDTGYVDDLAAWSIAAWVRSPEAPSGGDPSGPVHREDNYQISWNHSSSAWQGAAGLNAGGWYAASFGSLVADAWCYLAATYDGEVLKAYTNGNLITTNEAPSGPPEPETNSLKLGRHAASEQYFTGSVDEVRIYDRALSDGEILFLASQ